MWIQNLNAQAILLTSHHNFTARRRSIVLQFYDNKIGGGPAVEIGLTPRDQGTDGTLTLSIYLPPIVLI